MALPRTVAKPVKEKVVQAWEAMDVAPVLAAAADHRWAVGFQLGVLYGLRRSEVLALRWDDFDPEGRTPRIDERILAVIRGVVLDDATNVRSRRPVPLSDDAVRALKRRRTSGEGAYVGDIVATRRNDRRLHTTTGEREPALGA